MQPKMLESECPIFVEVDAADRIAARNAAIVDQGTKVDRLGSGVFLVLKVC